MSKPWTSLDDRRLREFYAQYPGDAQIVVASIASVLDRTPRAVRSRAHALGLSVNARPKGVPSGVEPIQCPICDRWFKPKHRGATMTRSCSRSCASKLSIREHGHARGFAGHSHSEESLATMSRKSQAHWDSAAPEERRAAGERLQAAMAGRPRSERQYTRGRGGKRADLDDRYFRSSWEANYARWLNYRRDVVGDIAAWDYEPKTFEFPVKHGTTSYTPDFLITFADGTSEWHEVKGWLTARGATALKRFAKHYPDETLILVDEEPYRAIASFARSVIETWE